jgi:hypothetical protein
MPNAIANYCRYIFARESKLSPHPVFVQVDARNKDAAVMRLVEQWPFIPASDWDFIDEIDPLENSIGRMGEHLPFREH